MFILIVIVLSGAAIIEIADTGRRILRQRQFGVNNSIKLMMIVLFLLNTGNFLLTNNPYRAYHSGRTAYDSTYTGSGFFISPAYIIIIVAVFAIIRILLHKRRLRVTGTQAVFAVGYVIAGLVNGSVFSSPKTFVFDLMMFLFTFQIAGYEVSRTERGNKKEPSELSDLYRLILILVFLGIVLAYLQRDRYGVINFDFSRRTRGEITYWLFTGLHISTVAYSLVSYIRSKKLKALLPAGIVLLFQMAFANRMGVLYIVIPLYVFLLLGTNASKKLLIGLATIFLVAIFWNDILSIFGINISEAMNYIEFLNGRSVLWDYYFNAIKEHTIFGAGLNLTSLSSYKGGAASEVGLLKMFGESGIIVGLSHVIIGIIAAINGLRIIRFNRTYEANDMDLFFSFYYMGCILPIILESHSRILNTADFFAWLSMYYLYLRKVNV